MTALLILTALLVTNLLLSAVFSWLGARRLRAERPWFGRALLATLLFFGASTLVQIAVVWLSGQVASPLPLVQILMAVLLLASFPVLGTAIFRWQLKATIGRGLVIWLVGLVPTIGLSCVTILVVIPHIVEAFVSPSNAMAPAILGDHYSTVCPRCNGELVVSPSNPMSGICITCLKVSERSGPRKRKGSPDRMIVDKLQKVRRWDMIVFRYPEDPSVNYLFRLVGLPGETVMIKEGGVWINGEKAALPSELAGLEYETLDDTDTGNFGTPARPTRLGTDEYFVLGDYSERANDSRLWGPLPAENVLGVVTVRYWPPSRWKVWR